MKKVSKAVESFFKELEKNSNTLDLNGISSQYSDTFVFADSSGTRVIKKEDFLKALPDRKAFVHKIGLKYTTTISVEETQLDGHYIMVEAHTIMHFEKDPKQPIDDKDSSTYILYKQDNSLKIVFHLEHRNLMEKLKNLGLWQA